MESLALGLFGILFTTAVPLIMVVLFVVLVVSTKKQEKLLAKILAEMKKDM